MFFFEDMKGAIRVFARIRWARSVSPRWVRLKEGVGD